MESPHFILGMKLAAAAKGISSDDLLQKKAYVETVSNPRVEGYGSIQRLVCKYAAEAYAESGKMDNFSYHVFEKLASARPWWPELDPYYEAAVTAIGRVHSQLGKEAAEKHNDTMLKEAAMFRNLAGGIGKVSPGLMKAVLAGGALTGTIGGSLSWMANRGVSQDASKIEAMKAKIKYYNQLSSEIENELKARGNPDDREEVEDVVEDII